MTTLDEEIRADAADVAAQANGRWLEGEVMAGKIGKVVTIQQVFAKNERGWFDIKDADDVRYSTKIEDIATAAKALKGQKAKITFREEQKGQYTNRYLDKVEPSAAEGFDTPPPSERDDTDWDAIAQGKTRCALYVAVYSNDSFFSYIASKAGDDSPVLPDVVWGANYLVEQAMKKIFPALDVADDPKDDEPF